MERLRLPEERRDKADLDEDGNVRLVQMTGRGSYVVSIPKSWIESTGLKKGGRVEFSRQQNQGLLLTPFDEHAANEISHCQLSLDPDVAPETAIRNIISLYLVGFSTIEVTSKSGTLSAAVRNGIRQVARQKLIGTEMVTESSRGTTLQVLLNYPQLSAPDALLRISSIMNSMVRDAVQALTANDKELAIQVIRTDDEIDRFSLYIIRQLKWGIRHPLLLEKIGIRSTVECLAYRVITANLERSADHAFRVAKQTLVFHRPLDQVLARDINALAHFSSDMMETALRALSMNDYDTAESTFLESENLAVLAARIMDRSSKKKMSAHDLSAFTLISESLRRIGEGATAVAEIVMDLTADKSIQPPVKSADAGILM